jgi:putative tryptophan/tyrosine transport system substrate-binding protein
VNDHRAAVIAAATRNKVPTISYNPAFAREGGLMSYAPSFTDMFRGAAGYVDRILRGDKAADLPVQMPTRNELVMTVPQTLLVSADEVIE